MNYPIILGCDPAIKNFGWCAIRVDSENGRYKILKAGILRHTLSNVHGDLEEQVAAYSKAINRILEKYQPTIIVCERFETRIQRRLSGSAGEAVNAMIGILMANAVAKSISIITVLPGAWKSKVRHRTPLPKMYNVGRARIRKLAKEKGSTLKRSQDIQSRIPHATDAACLALLRADIPIPSSLPIHVANTLF